MKTGNYPSHPSHVGFESGTKLEENLKYIQVKDVSSEKSGLFTN